MNKFKHIMIIDDDPIEIFITERILLLHSVCDHIVCSLNGPNALKELKKFHSLHSTLPELILVGLNMPETHELELIMELMNEPCYAGCQSTIVVLAENPVHDLLGDIVKEEIVGRILLKPLGIDELMKITSKNVS